MQAVELNPKQRELLRKIGKKSRKETELRIGQQILTMEIQNTFDDPRIQTEVAKQVLKDQKKPLDAKRIGKEYLGAIARKQGKHGKKGGRPAWKYPPCMKDGKKQKRHRFWNLKCSLCGIPQVPPNK